MGLQQSKLINGYKPLITVYIAVKANVVDTFIIWDAVYTNFSVIELKKVVTSPLLCP